MESGERNADLRPSRPEDLAPVLLLLEQCDLPVAGVADSFEHFVVAEEDGTLAGVAGLEVHGTDGLLRSVAVRADRRGSGLGGALTEEIVTRCALEGLCAVYLLTETAARFFPRYGFRRITRSDVPDSIRSSAEFRELCPDSAAVMVRFIQPS